MIRTRSTQLLAALTALATLATGAFAADSNLSAGDTAWVLGSSALVLLMVPGLALFYAGMVRSKNVLHTIMMSFICMGIVGVQWVVFGYSLAFGGAPHPLLGGIDQLMLAGMTPDSLKGTIPTLAFALFQGMFAVITPALISGAIVERVKFSAYAVLVLLWSVLVYDPLAHWVWGDGGWLLKLGCLDFAGGTVVHISSGASALAAILVLGKRRGYLQENFVPHNLTLTIFGAGLLWFGWFGFNAGSALAANGDAGMAMLVTHLSAAAGALTWLGIEWIKFGKPSALGAVTGLVAGLGTITPASGYVGPAAALLIGTMAGTVCFFATQGLKRVLKIDDSLDVFPVHGVGGILGTLAAGIFASSELGVFSGQGLATGRGIGTQLLTQACGVAAVGLYTALMTWVLLRVAGALVGLRVSAEEETEGLDVVLHNERGYDL